MLGRTVQTIENYVDGVVGDNDKTTDYTYCSAGKVLTYNYVSGINNDISRLSSMGIGTVVKLAHSLPTSPALSRDLTYQTAFTGDYFRTLTRDFMHRRNFMKYLSAATPMLFSGEGLFSAAAQTRSNDLFKPLSLKQSLELAGQNMLDLLDPDNNYLPYWQLIVHKDYRAQFENWWCAHNIGRWLDAMFRLEEAIGFKLPENVVAAMTENTHRYFDNPDHISLNPDEEPLFSSNKKKAKFWDLHSLREGMLALNALARWRNDQWAIEMGRKMVASVNAKLKDDGKWDISKFDASKRSPNVIHNFSGCDTHGRMLEAVIWFYETTGDLSALRLADRLAQIHLKNTTTANGTINPAIRADHTHSYFGTLRGLLLYGKLTSQQIYIDRVAKAYEVTVPKHVHESGYTSHNMAAESVGETTSPGDALQIAMWLGQLGHGDLFDDVERLVRARELPSQIRDTPSLKPVSDAKNDSVRDLSKRVIGAYGGCHALPHSHKISVTDVTAATLHSLIDVYNHIVDYNGGQLRVLFHFDLENAKVKITSTRAKLAELVVMTKIEAPLSIRIPKFATGENLRVEVNKHEQKPLLTGNFLQLGKLPAGTKVTVQYDLPERTTKESGMGKNYEINWRGDEITSVSPSNDFYPFYPSGAIK
ncbi:hypothetical protein BH11PLA2_BH11PLA2_40790 [soil metagenome]